MTELYHPPGRHVAGVDIGRVMLEREIRRIEETRHPWRVTLTNGVELVSECDAFLRMLIEAGRVALMTTRTRAGDLIVASLL